MALKKAAPARRKKVAPRIIIDESQGLTFASEDALYDYFSDEIEVLEREFFSLRTTDDIPEQDFSHYENHLNLLLEDPDEVWEDRSTLDGRQLMIYVKQIGEPNGNILFHVAVCYLTEDVPSFVYLHFPTTDASLVSHYRRERQVYDRSMKDVPVGACEGDALSEGEELAVGLYQAMLKLRSDKDIPEEEFPLYFELREEAIENADEIWRTSDSMGNQLVTFIKEFDGEDEEIFYIAVTVEDGTSGSHALLFSFPTTDQGLVGRYRHGENLQAEEVVQEASH